MEAPGPDGDAARRRSGDTIRATKAREFQTLGLVLGARYDGSPIVVPDGTAPPPEDILNYMPSACPGGLAPHAWLADGSSLYDHFGPGLTLLATEGPATEGESNGVAPMLEHAAEQGVPLTVVAPDEPCLRARYAARFALIRPDQHVAWRGDTLPDPATLLSRITGWPS